MDATDDINGNWIPREGMEFNSLNDAWEFWIAYGGKAGFSVCKHYENKNKEGQITSKRFVGSKEGFRAKDKRDHMTKNPRAETRTGCRARMGVSFISQTDKYRVYVFVAEHNHILHLPEYCHMLPSQRGITPAQAFEVELADDSGIRPRATYEFMGRQAGGRENLVYTRQNQKKYLRNRRKRDLQYGEAGSILWYFQKQSLEDPLFYHAVQLDSYEHITNIFWADARMLLDYSLFGDVITFNTTYSTNKEYRPFGVFVGFNNHKCVVIFGAALLYDETSDSFTWLFEQFLKAHKKKPSTIFTDQDAAMAKALTTVMPETRHGLCTWHIMQNGIKHHGNLMKDGSEFLKDFNKIMYKYDDERKFEESWSLMRSTYPVSNSLWLDGIYKVKEKWVKCYMKTAFTIGMRSTQLSESLNGDLKDYLKSDLDVAQFFKHFERVVNDKRYNELQEEYNARAKLPRIKVRSSNILNQVAQVYTPKIFELFQEEWEKTFGARVIHRDEGDTIRVYTIAIDGQEGEYTVTTIQSDLFVSCSCRKFENVGFLCCHNLKTLDFLDIKFIPEKYILKRWSRAARDSNIEEAKGNEVNKSAKLEANDRYRDLCPDLVNLASWASECGEGYLLVKKACVELSKQVDEIRKNHSEIHLSTSNNECAEIGISLNNLFKNVKGLKKRDGRKGAKRPKILVEKQPKKRKTVAKTGTSRKDHKFSSQDKFHVYKGVEIPQSVSWMNYEYDDISQDQSQNSFMNLLRGITEYSAQYPIPPATFNQGSSVIRDVEFGHESSTNERIQARLHCDKQTCPSESNEVQRE